MRWFSCYSDSLQYMYFSENIIGLGLFVSNEVSFKCDKLTYVYAKNKKLYGGQVTLIILHKC